MSSYVEMMKYPKCDLCDAEAHYDGKTKDGPWAYLCDEHMDSHGVGVGTGRGQRLVLLADDPAKLALAERLVREKMTEHP